MSEECQSGQLQSEEQQGERHQETQYKGSQHIILASSSPRRKEILERAGIPFEVMTPDVDEHVDDAIAADPELAAKTIAERKAGAVVQELLASDSIHGTYVVLAADTTVVLDGRIFGKPHGFSEAKGMLRALSGKTHQVITGVSVWMIVAERTDVASASDPSQPRISMGHRTFADVSHVTFKRLSDDAINDYLAKGESYDKAGAYAIQGEGRNLVANLEGDYDNVVGLPLHRIQELFPQIFGDTATHSS